MPDEYGMLMCRCGGHATVACSNGCESPAFESPASRSRFAPTVYYCQSCGVPCSRTGPGRSPRFCAVCKRAKAKQRGHDYYMRNRETFLAKQRVRDARRKQRLLPLAKAS